MDEIGKPWRMIGMGSRLKKDRLYGRHYIRGQCSLTLGAKSIGKSTLALTEAIAMATGRNLLGIEPKGRFKWFYYDLFNPLDEVKLRVMAICKTHGIDQKELEGWLFIQSGRDLPLSLITGKEGIINELAFQRLTRDVKFYKIDGITLDPVIFTSKSPHTFEVVGALCSRLSVFAKESNIAIELVHLKLSAEWAEMLGENWEVIDALTYAAQTVRELQPMEPVEAARLGLKTHWDHFRISTISSNCFWEPGKDN